VNSTIQTDGGVSQVAQKGIYESGSVEAVGLGRWEAEVILKVKQVIFAKGYGGFFFDDQAAIRAGLVPDGFVYKATPRDPSFKRVRAPAEAVSVILILEDGQISIGDCCAVQYSGAGGRDPLFRASGLIPWMEEHIKPKLLGIDCSSFKANARIFDSLATPEGSVAHTAIRYGVTQALLDATAKTGHRTIAEVVANEYDTAVSHKPIRVFAQSGDNRYDNVDKMILKGVDVLPHGLINSPDKMGPGGEKFKEYVVWVRKRVVDLRIDGSYSPELHFDVYGTLGIVFNNDDPRIVDYLGVLEKTAAPFQLRIEAPVDAGSREGQVEALGEIRRLLLKKGIRVEIVADEWCNTLEDIRFFAENSCADMLQIKPPDLGGINNTIEAVFLCKAAGVKAYQGGSCTETDVSARICTQVSLATQPYQILAKPGMGVDEGFMIVQNELERTIQRLDKAAY